MARLTFTDHVSKVAPGAGGLYPGENVRDVLNAAFAAYPRLRNYILDDQGRLRKHVCVFVDGVRAAPAEALDMKLSEGAEIYVMQALSGG